jgi:exodeoxyribonuclease VII small subunit
MDDTPPNDISAPETAPGGAEIGYAEAMAELEQILADIEQDDVDIDVLAGKVRRASDLIRLCRERIHGARMEVEQIVTELGGGES